MAGTTINQLTICLQIAALSPADINHDETLSTLRYGKWYLTLSPNISCNLIGTSELPEIVEQKTTKELQKGH